MTTVTAVTAFLRAGAVSKTSSRSSRLSRGSGVKCQGGIPVGGDCRKAIQPEPLDIWPTEDTCRVVERLCLSTTRQVEKFRRGAGRPFQRAALLGVATAVAGGKAPAPPRRAHGTFAPTGRKCHSGLLHFPQEVTPPNPRPFSTTKHLKQEDFCLWREATVLTVPTQEI